MLGLQPEALIYHPTDKGYILDLQEKIEQLLKNKIMEWRSRFITRWNRHCTQIMRKLLPRCVRARSRLLCYLKYRKAGVHMHCSLFAACMYSNCTHYF